MGEKSTGWLASKAIATAILRDRAQRRQFISGVLIVLLAWICLGVWPLASWLSQGLWRFSLYWGACALLCLFLLLMALFDALSVVKEEHDEVDSSKDSDLL